MPIKELQLPGSTRLARAALRERKFDEAHEEWLRELRARAYIEMREAPL